MLVSKDKKNASGNVSFHSPALLSAFVCVLRGNHLCVCVCVLMPGSVAAQRAVCARR